MPKNPELEAHSACMKLYAKLSKREGKYVRNFNRYNNNGVRRENLWSPDSAPLAFVSPAVGTEGVQTQINVLKSIVDSLTSKISQANVRPYFSSIAGDYDTSQTTSLIQRFFDVWLDEQHAYPKSVLCFRDAAVLDIGVMGINPEGQGIERIPPWEYFLDPAEYASGTVTHAMRLRKYYPLAGLKDRINNKELAKRLDDDPQTQDEYKIYWDLYHGKKWEFYDRLLVTDPIDIDYEQYGGLYRRPFVEMYYTRPVKGFFSTSLVDDIYPTQKQIDALVMRLDAATRNAITGMVFVNRSSGAKASDMENGFKAYSYTAEQGGTPATVVTPPPIDKSWFDALEFYIGKAYEMAGISQLSAQSKKQPGLDSGKALDTMEDIESDRFNTQLQQFTHFLVDVTRVCIDTFPKGVPILPRKISGEKVSWGDARKQRDAMSIQFSAASSLSKNPEEKRKEIEFLSAQGLIDNSQIADFYDMPDLENAYGLATASLKACEKVIDRCIKNGETEYNETIDLEMLKKKTIKQINKMEAAGDDEKYIDNLEGLLIKVDADQKAVAQYVTPPPPAAPPEPMRNDALDAGQVTAIANIIAQATAGAIPAKSALALIGTAFPKLDKKMVLEMIPEAKQEIEAGAQAAQQLQTQGVPPPGPPTNIQGAPNG